MSLRSFLILCLVGYVITSVASISICTIHGTNPCRCLNTIQTHNQPICGNGNTCTRCGGLYQPSMVYYKPTNDMYSCSTMVKPALVPETCPCYCHVSPVHDKELVDHHDIDRAHPIEHNPVDSVSLTLAKRLFDQSKHYTPESKFWFGPEKMPRIDLPKITRKNIPEERLFAMERDVIELKPRKSKWGWNDDSSAEDSSSSSSSSSSESSSSESNEGSQEIKRTELTYKEIGYDRIKVNDCDNMDKNSIKLSPPTSIDVPPVEERIESLSCPFVPGQVILRKRITSPFDDGHESYDDLTERIETLFSNGARGWNRWSKFNRGF